MEFFNQYREKLRLPDEAVRVIQSGDWVDYGSMCGQVVSLDKALARRKDELKDIKIWSLLNIFPTAIAEADPQGGVFTWNSWHLSGRDRNLIKSGFPVYYSSIRYSELPRYVREHIEPIDVAMLQVCPMDSHGFFNFGPQCSHSRAVCERARVVIVEVNRNMPRCLGGYEEAIHISEVDYIVEGENSPLPELPAAVPTEVDEKAAAFIIDEMQDNCCIQLGIGGMPDAVGKMIAGSDLKDLGCHTEMMVDAYVDMYEAGRLTNRKKNINPGKMVYTFAVGSRRLYDFLDNNCQCSIFPVNYTNNPAVASLNDGLISINNALEVDLFGQVCAESIGTRIISGTGGQLDFVIAGYESRGGKSFICLPSCNTDGAGNIVSRIKPTLTPGAIVTDPRSVAQIIVTEYGKFDMKGKTVWQRAEGLIGLAHPAVRDELVQSADKMGIWRKSNQTI